MSQDELAFRVERALGKPLASVVSPRFTVRVEPAPNGYAARLELTGGGTQGERDLSARSCDELTQSIALAIALAISSREHAEEQAETAAPAAEDVDRVPTASGAAATLTPPATDGVREDAVPEASGPGVAALAWGFADTGSLPAAGFGVALGAELAWSSVSIRAAGLLLPARQGSVDAADPSSAGAAVGLALGTVLGCVPLGAAGQIIGMGVCAGWELGRLSGYGTGVDHPHHAGTLWSAARIDLSGRWRPPGSSWGLELLVTAAAPLTRDEFALKGIGSVYRPASVVGRASLGVSWGLAGGE